MHQTFLSVLNVSCKVGIKGQSEDDNNSATTRQHWKCQSRTHMTHECKLWDK